MLALYRKKTGSGDGIAASVRKLCFGGRVMSSGKFPDPREVHAFRRGFNDRWARFVAETFRSKSLAALTFGRDESTVRSWLQSMTGPSGDAVAIAFRDYPAEAARFLIGGWRTLIRRAGGACKA